MFTAARILGWAFPKNSTCIPPIRPNITRPRGAHTCKNCFYTSEQRMQMPALGFLKLLLASAHPCCCGAVYGPKEIHGYERQTRKGGVGKPVADLDGKLR